MSRLYYTEDGRVLPTLCEELTRFRYARKTLSLPPTEEAASLYLLARSYPDNEKPLRLSVNGEEAAAIEPDRPGAYDWHEISVAADRLKAGENVFELWTDTASMTGWSLALEPGHASPGSAVSDDGGETWRSERMGYLNAVLGEYVIRVRLAEGDDPPPPRIVWERPEGERPASLRKVMPPVARDQGPLLKRVRAISSWLASSWEHTSSARAEQYCPWDAETILAWGGAQSGHGGHRPITMCVHYAAAFVSAAQSVGIPARCAVLTDSLNGIDGHFVTEVWFEDYGKWVMVDPNADAILFRNGQPMSMGEIQEAGSDLKGLIEWGPGTEYQRTFPHMVAFVEDNLEKGLCFRHRSVWYRGDLLSRPDLSPPGHGALSYCETGLVWEKPDLDAGFGMFLYFGDADYFNAPPDFGEA